jgi:hypothetical protein
VRIGPSFDARFEMPATGMTLSDLMMKPKSGWTTGAPTVRSAEALCLVFRRTGFMSHSIQTNLAAEVRLFRIRAALLPTDD